MDIQKVKMDYLWHIQRISTFLFLWVNCKQKVASQLYF